MFLRVIRRAPQWNLNAIPQRDFPSLCLPSWADPQPLYLRYIKTRKGYFRALLDHVQRGAPSPQWNVSSIKQMCLLFQVVGRLPKKYFRLVRLVWSGLVCNKLHHLAAKVGVNTSDSTFKLVSVRNMIL